MGDRCSVALVHNHYNINLTDQKKKKMKEVKISSHALFSRPRAFIWLKNIKGTIYTKLLDDRIRMFSINNQAERLIFCSHLENQNKNNLKLQNMDIYADQFQNGFKEFYKS